MATTADMSIRNGPHCRHLEAFLAEQNEMVDSLFIAFGTQDADTYAKMEVVELDDEQGFCQYGAGISGDTFRGTWGVNLDDLRILNVCDNGDQHVDISIPMINLQDSVCTSRFKSTSGD